MKRALAFAAGTALALGTMANAEAHDFGHHSWRERRLVAL
jgi:hypothetical protein